MLDPNLVYKEINFKSNFITSLDYLFFVLSVFTLLNQDLLVNSPYRKPYIS